MVNDYFEWLVNQHEMGKADIHLIFNGIDYDRNFSFNKTTGVLLAESSLSSNGVFGSNGITIAQYINLGKIEIRVIFK